MELFNRAESTSMLEILHLVFSLGHHAGAATNLESDLAWTKAFAQDMAKILCHPSFQVNSAEDKLARVLQYTVLCRTNDRSLPWKMPGHDLAKPCLGMQRLSRESSQIMEGPLSLHLRAPADGRCDCPECEECHLLVMIGRLIGYRILTTQARVTTFPSEMFVITEADVSVVCRALDTIQPIEVSHEILDQASQSTCQGTCMLWSMTSFTD